MPEDIKEWVRVSRAAHGGTVVTVTLVQGNITSKWAGKAFRSVKEGLKEARKYAHENLQEMVDAMEAS